MMLDVDLFSALCTKIIPGTKIESTSRNKTENCLIPLELLIPLGKAI